MKEVEAVKDKGDILKIAILLETHHSRQMSLIWEFGVNTALRISDLLSIKYSDIEGDRLKLKEGKTGKEANIKLNNKAQTIVQWLRSDYPDDIYLFQSHSRNVRGVKPLTRQAVGQALTAVGEMASVGINLGTHSMRKTRGYHLYQQTNDIARVMKMLRHSSQAETLRYIGIDQQTLDDDFDSLEL